MSGQDSVTRQPPILSDISTSEENSDNGTNLLDPHLSILQYLETEDKGPSVPSTSQTAIDITMSDSWHNVEKSELLDEDTRPQSVLSTATQNQNLNNISNVDILSSTDTSSVEDLPHDVTPPANTLANTESITSILNSQHGTSFYSTSLPNAQNSLSQNGSDETNTNTVTNSFSSSSNSFIMPKLSFKPNNNTFSLLSSQQQTNNIDESVTKKCQILILGRHGLKFFKSIPIQYQTYFQLPTSHDPKDYQTFRALIIIVKELRELITLLNRISKLESGGPPLVVLYDKDQRVQVKNVLKSFLRNELISLYYPPFDMDNEEELQNLFEHIKYSFTTSPTSTTLQLSSTSVPASTSSTSATFTTSSKRLTKSGVSINKRKRKGKKKSRIFRRESGSGSDTDPKAPKGRRWFHYIFNKWVMVGVSLTAGVGTTYYFTHTDKRSFPFMNTLVNKLRQVPIIRNFRNIFQTKEPEVMDHPHCPVPNLSLRSPIKCWTDVLKYSYDKVNNFIKDTIIYVSGCHDVSFGRLGKLHNWNVDDPNNFITLSYITV